MHAIKTIFMYVKFKMKGRNNNKKIRNDKEVNHHSEMRTWWTKPHKNTQQMNWNI